MFMLFHLASFSFFRPPWISSTSIASHSFFIDGIAFPLPLIAFDTIFITASRRDTEPFMVMVLTLCYAGRTLNHLCSLGFVMPAGHTESTPKPWGQCFCKNIVVGLKLGWLNIEYMSNAQRRPSLWLDRACNVSVKRYFDWWLMIIYRWSVVAAWRLMIDDWW